MPTYTVKYSNFKLTPKQKKFIADGITKTHSKFTGANTFFAQVIFQKNENNSHFMGGKLPSAIGSFELYQKMGVGHKLTASEQLIWTAMQQRFEQLTNAAAQAAVVLMIDAEESWIQDGVDLLVLPLLVKYNSDKVVLALTIQLYLKDRNLVYKRLLKDADKRGYVLGVKLVRGAYMEKERSRAAALKISAPVCETKDATDVCIMELL